jgi:ketosteroid isomerase-like protein
MLTAVHSVIEEVQRKTDKPQDIHILATNVYVKTPHGWRIVTHHASVATGEPPADLFKASVLH